jgi:sulfate permease, SulP family
MLPQDILRFFPFVDLRTTNRESLRKDTVAAASVLFLSVPQGVAYALIAGLPPAMGLYAGALPAIFGSLFRSSRHVVTGPTNALSLLIGTAAAANVSDPVGSAATLALMVGLFQLGAGLLRLGALVDYISSAVVLGYITGAGILVGAGQLGNITSSPMGEGHLFPRLYGWLVGLPGADLRTIALAGVTAGGILVFRRLKPQIPGPILMLALGILAAWLFGFSSMGILLVADVAPVPAGLPPLVTPDISQAGSLFSLAIAATVLSLVESSAVSRTIAGRSGQLLDSSVEFSGQGIGNIAAGLFGGYPVSGSLSRSILNEKVGGNSRLSGALTGVFMLVALLWLGPLINLTPLASLAGLILVIAIDLIDIKQIRTVMRSHPGDRMAFLATAIGSFFLTLDLVIYLGILISMIQFLHKARLINVGEMVVNQDRNLIDIVPGLVDTDAVRHCSEIRIVHVEGSLFFGAANSLTNALEATLRESRCRVLIVRLRRAHDLDYTSISALKQVYSRSLAANTVILLVDLPPALLKVLEDQVIDPVFDSTHLFPIQPAPLGAMKQAMARGLDIVGDHSCESTCPIQQVLTKPSKPEAHGSGSAVGQ